MLTLKKLNGCYQATFYTKSKRVIFKKEKTSKIKVRDYKQEACERAKRNFYELGFNNEWTHFITLTYAPKNVHDNDAHAILLKVRKLLNRYRDYYDKNFKFLIVPEYGKNNTKRLHFHGLIFTTKKELLKEATTKNKKVYNSPYFEKHLGFNAFVEITKKSPRCISYCAKYITKEDGSIFKYFYFASKGLSKALKIIIEDDNPCYSIAKKLVEKEKERHELRPNSNHYTTTYYLTKKDVESICGLPTFIL